VKRRVYLKVNSLTNTSKHVRGLNWSEPFVWSGYCKFGGGVDMINLAVEEEIIGEIIRDLGCIAEDLHIRYLQYQPATGQVEFAAGTHALVAVEREVSLAP
jgi:hypothetical protein